MVFFVLVLAVNLLLKLYNAHDRIDHVVEKDVIFILIYLRFMSALIS